MEVELNVKMTNNLKIKLDYLSSDNFNKEVGGWLVGVLRKDGILIEDVIIPEQEVSSSEVDINTSGMAKMCARYKKKCEKIIGHWHSHHSMGCFWSGTDEENMKNIMDSQNLFLFIVSSKGEHLCRAEIRKPFFISVDKIDYEIFYPQEDKIIERLEKHLAEVVKDKVYKQTNYSNYSGYSGYDNDEYKHGGDTSSSRKTDYEWERDLKYDSDRKAVKQIFDMDEIDRQTKLNKKKIEKGEIPDDEYEHDRYQKYWGY